MTDSTPLPTPAYVVLGMIGLGARSGYEIKRTVDRSIRYFWTISQAQIYPALGRLERDGLIVGRDSSAGRRPKREFELTDAGRDRLRSWLTGAGDLTFELRDVGLLKLFFADSLDPDEASEILRGVRQRSEDRVTALRAIQPDAEGVRDAGSAFPLLNLEIGIAFHQAIADVAARWTTPEDREG